MTLGILSCVWQRPERLTYTLDQLAAQSVDDWFLYLINNNPELHDFVEDTANEYDLPMMVIHNGENHGPFARWEVAHEAAELHDHFLTLDDDVNFSEELLESWQDQAEDDAVLGWNGFRFQSDYWHREQVEIYESCHYVWGSNMLVPAHVAGSKHLLELEREYWQCDDLWLCYVANHLLDFDIRRADIDISIQVDGKDTYPGQHRQKVLFLESLRKRGWMV